MSLLGAITQSLFDMYFARIERSHIPEIWCHRAASNGTLHVLTVLLIRIGHRVIQFPLLITTLQI
jgi:hypothetical protein